MQVNSYRKLFPNPKSIIGMIALPPMLGYPEFTTMEEVIERALGDLDTLQQGGVDGVCIENDYDRPHRMVVGSEVVASFTRVAMEVMRQSSVPVGIGVLLNDWRASLAIAKVVDAGFVRLDFFVDRVRIAAGIIEPEPDAVIVYRRQIKAENVALFTDLQVKHSELLEPGKRLSVSAEQAIAKGADALIISGKITGDSPTQIDLSEVRNAAPDFPVLIGSGLTASNAPQVLKYADGAIVGTSLKDSMDTHARVQANRVKELMAVVQILRAETPE